MTVILRLCCSVRNKCHVAKSTFEFKCSDLILTGPSGVRPFADMIGCRTSEGRTSGTTCHLLSDDVEAFLSTLDVEIGGYHTEIDHTIVSKRLCLTDVAVVLKFYTGSDYRLLLRRFSFTRRETKAAKFRERSTRTINKLDISATLVSSWEDSAMDCIDEDYDRLVEHLHDCTRKAESFKTTKKRLSLEYLELICQCGVARAAGNRELTSELARLCREAIKEDLKEKRAEVLAEAAETGKSIHYAAMPVETSPVARQG
ncbi:hypothetical protein RB195_005276 [Necator americanus]|uniref:Uncharacterized protein n=1 Tax=Necator americanus TaxID=51031 RepID=A0ABR1BM17_NECAM